MKIIIDPEDDIQYMSFYIRGLIDRFGFSNVVYNRQAFSELSDADRATRTMRFIIKDGTHEKRYTIDTNDSYRINESLYDWCDVYGNINTNWAKTPHNLQSKLISLCPSFAIRYTHPILAWPTAVTGVCGTQRPKRKYLGCWRRMLQRPQIDNYTPRPARDNYIFHLSTLWQSDEWNRNNEGVNLRRASFIRACQSLESEIKFEGGLVASLGNPSIELFSDCLASRMSEAYHPRQDKRVNTCVQHPGLLGLPRMETWRIHGPRQSHPVHAIVKRSAGSSGTRPAYTYHRCHTRGDDQSNKIYAFPSRPQAFAGKQHP